MDRKESESPRLFSPTEDLEAFKSYVSYEADLVEHDLMIELERAEFEQLDDKKIYVETAQQLYLPDGDAIHAAQLEDAMAVLTERWGTTEMDDSDVAAIITIGNELFSRQEGGPVFFEQYLRSLPNAVGDFFSRIRLRLITAKLTEDDIVVEDHLERLLPKTKDYIQQELEQQLQ